MFSTKLATLILLAVCASTTSAAPVPLIVSLPDENSPIEATPPQPLTLSTGLLPIHTVGSLPIFSPEEISSIEAAAPLTLPTGLPHIQTVGTLPIVDDAPDASSSAIISESTARPVPGPVEFKRMTDDRLERRLRLPKLPSFKKPKPVAAPETPPSVAPAPAGNSGPSIGDAVINNVGQVIGQVVGSTVDGAFGDAQNQAQIDQQASEFSVQTSLAAAATEDPAAATTAAPAATSSAAALERRFKIGIPKLSKSKPVAAKPDVAPPANGGSGTKTALIGAGADIIGQGLTGVIDGGFSNAQNQAQLNQHASEFSVQTSLAAAAATAEAAAASATQDPAAASVTQDPAAVSSAVPAKRAVFAKDH